MKPLPIEELIPTIDPKNPPKQAWELAESIAALVTEEDERERPA